MDIDAQIADTLGILDGFHTAAHDDESRIRALAAKLRYLEQRRYHEFLGLQVAEKQDAMQANLNDIADALKTMLANQAEPRDHTVMESRAMGVSLRLVGKSGDPLLEEIARTLLPEVEALAKLRGRVAEEDRISLESERSQDAMDRAVDRRLRMNKAGGSPDASGQD